MGGYLSDAGFFFIKRLNIHLSEKLSSRPGEIDRKICQFVWMGNHHVMTPRVTMGFPARI